MTSLNAGRIAQLHHCRPTPEVGGDEYWMWVGRVFNRSDDKPKPIRSRSGPRGTRSYPGTKPVGSGATLAAVGCLISCSSDFSTAPEFYLCRFDRHGEACDCHVLLRGRELK